jgi:hypothetical protein
MPSLFWRLFQFIGPFLVKYGFKMLMKKYPGLFPVIQDIIKWIDEQPDKEEAAEEVKKVLYSTASLPEPRGMA